MKVLVAGSLNMDLIVHVDRMPKEGETLLGSSLKTHIGGKGINQASASALQGVETAMFGVVGNDDFGNEILKSSEKLGIKSFISRSDDSTGTAIIEKDADGKNRIVVIPGANSHCVMEDFGILDDYSIIVMQFEIPIPTVEKIAENAKKQNKLVILNPAPAFKMSDELLSNIDILIPNEHELGIVSGKSTDTFAEIESAAAYLIQKGVPEVLVTQ